MAHRTFLAALLVGGMLVVPRLVRFVERRGTPEIIVVAAGALCFGLALLAMELGYSVALGAFLAGMLTAESGRGAEVEHRIAPLEDLFVARRADRPGDRPGSGSSVGDRGPRGHQNADEPPRVIGVARVG